MQPTTVTRTSGGSILTYEELCSFEVLYKAYLEARKGKRSKSKTIEYESHALACTEKLSRKLAVCNVRQPDGSIRQQIRYVPSKFEVFAVYEPKRRMVHRPPHLWTRWCCTLWSITSCMVP